VPHAEFASISPSGRILCVARENDRLETLDVLLITGVQQEWKIPGQIGLNQIPLLTNRAGKRNGFAP
jgi:hypothetical protein